MSQVVTEALGVTAFILVICFGIGFICFCFYRKKTNHTKANVPSYENKEQDSEIGMLILDRRDKREKFVGNDAFKEMDGANRLKRSNSSFALERSNYHKKIETKAMSKGINLNVQSCASIKYKLLLATSNQLGYRNQVGVFNKGKKIKKGTRFGPLEERNTPEKWCLKLDQLGYDRSYKELEDGHNWLYYVKLAPEKEATNMDVIFKEDDNCYYESTRDIPKGRELVSDWAWMPTSSKDEH